MNLRFLIKHLVSSQPIGIIIIKLDDWFPYLNRPNNAYDEIIDL